MNDNEQALQAVVEYYRNKSNKLEHDFLIYKISTDQKIRTLSEQARVSNEDKSVAED